MGAVQIEVVARTIEIGRHRGKVFCAVLAVVAPAHLDARDLGNRVGTIRGLKWPGKQDILPGWAADKASDRCS